MPFTDLPDEILLNVISRLSGRDILSFKLVNQKFRGLYGDSAKLQYLVELDIAGCCDPNLTTDFSHEGEGDENSKAETTTVSRLQYLRAREANWKELRLFRNVFNIDFPFKYVGLYDMVAGYFFCGTRGKGAGIKYVDFKKAMSENASPDSDVVSSPADRWQHVAFDDLILDFGLSLHENDLIAIVSMDEKEDR